MEQRMARKPAPTVQLHQESPRQLCNYIEDSSKNSLQTTLPRRAWVKLNRLRTDVGFFRATMPKCLMASTLTCECGAKDQSTNNNITSCPPTALLKKLVECRADQNCGMAFRKLSKHLKTSNLTSTPHEEGF